jgi:hypothetical protein
VHQSINSSTTALEANSTSSSRNVGKTFKGVCCPPRLAKIIVLHQSILRQLHLKQTEPAAAASEENKLLNLSVYLSVFHQGHQK